MEKVTRRGFLRAAGGALLFSHSLLSCNSRRKPNIIFILADDLGYGDLGCYGQQKIKTPSLDRLAKEGMRFTQHYAGTTVCAPSRCSLMTGLHTGHAFVRGNVEISGYQLAIPEETVTVGKILKKAGYSTGVIGKWGLGGPETSGHPIRQGFDYFFGYLGQVQAHFYYPPDLWENETQIILEENRDGGQKQYSHDQIALKSLEFIRKHSKGPFFLYLAFTIPHAELMVPEDSMRPYMGRFPEIPYTGTHYGSQPNPRAAYAGMVSRMDRDIGRIRDLLAELCIERDTLIMFSSDNGPHQEGGNDPSFFGSSGPFRGIKRDLYEGGLRVPLICCWPGMIQEGTVTDHVSAFWDLLPTICELSGQRPVTTDGISFVPALLGKSQKKHESLYWEFHERGGKQAVRTGKWKGIRLNVGTDPEGPVEIYDLEKDPGETMNIASYHPDIVKKIKGIMKDARTPSLMFRFGRQE